MSVIRPAVALLFAFTMLTGMVYPAFVTGGAQLLFPGQANGSLIKDRGELRGSRFIGQRFSGPGHFWSRPSATAPNPYHAAASGGSNLGPLNPALAAAVKVRVETLRAADPGNTRPVPVDLVTASGSGLDPHISPAAALYQVERVARVRGMSPGALRDLVAQHTEGRWLDMLGEARVNVLELNTDLDQIETTSRAGRIRGTLRLP